MWGTLLAGANLMVTNGLTINGTLRVGNPSNSWWGGISFTGSQTLSSNGAVVFGDQVRNNPSFNTLRLANGGTTLADRSGRYNPRTERGYWLRLRVFGVDNRRTSA